jgi:YrbI family 3-deoxy-D-manno-octulosonate 8-phosphate phosphatase
MKIICVIPARGGSKGIPNKNLQLVGGLPLIARSVLASVACKAIVKTYVSSDSDRILKIGEQYGASTIKRDINISGDENSTEDVLLHCLEFLKKEGTEPEILVYLQCTSPFTTAKDIDKVIKSLLDNNDVDCVFSAMKDHSFLWKISDQGFAKGVNHTGYEQRLRRQDLQTFTYRENGAVYAIRVPALLKSKNRFGYKALPVVAAEVLPFEIDKVNELHMAQVMNRLFPTPAINNNFYNIKLVVMDFDGVHTNDLAFLSQDGVESVQVSRADGLGCGLLKEAGYKLLILTREENPVVIKRAEKLGVEIINGVKDKLSVLKQFCNKNELEQKHVAYIGNDINDLDCLKWAGLSVIPADANINLLKYGFTILDSSGGKGAIRELAEILIKK